MKFLLNPAVDRLGPYPFHSMLNQNGLQRALAVVRKWADYSPTRHIQFDALARQLDVALVSYKDESGRFGVGSFKALGGCWGSHSALAMRGASPDKPIVRLCCASDGNHGRAVAWAARTIGVPATVLVPDVCSEERAAAISMFGAQVIRIPGSYEDALAESIAAAHRNDWTLVSDTAYTGCDNIPVLILSAYQIIAYELSTAGFQVPSHVFVQAGTGGLAAAMCSFFWERHGAQRPRLTVIEASVAPCLFESARRGSPIRIDAPHDTVMAGLACGAASTAAWNILRTGADAFATISDNEALHSVAELASGAYGQKCLAGESGSAGLCGLTAIASDLKARAALGINLDSVLLTIGTEGPLLSLIHPPDAYPSFTE